MPGLSVNPFQMTTSPGTFNLESGGMIQGLTMDSPSVRNRLSGGVVALDETLPMWGGVAICESIPQGIVVGSSTGPKALGGYVRRATAVTGGAKPITGFSVFDQAHSMVMSPNNTVPIAFPGWSCHFYRLGTGARIPVACDPSLVALQTGLINQQVSWDFVGQRLVPYTASNAQIAITAATYNTGTGQFTFTTASAHGFVPGNDFSITGMTPVGYNGSFTGLTGTTGSTLVAALPIGQTPPTATTATGFGVLAAGGGALVNVNVLVVDATNCMTVSYDPNAGNYVWNRNGACALIQI